MVLGKPRFSFNPVEDDCRAHVRILYRRLLNELSSVLRNPLMWLRVARWASSRIQPANWRAGRCSR